LLFSHEGNHRQQLAAESALTRWMEDSRSSSVLKIDITSMIDVNKNMLMSANEKLTNQQFFNSV